MFLRLLDKLVRKKIVLDRGPSHPEFHKAKPWMERYYLLFRRRPKWFPFNILIHKMLDDDHGEGVHNHLCPYITIILKGGYWETTPKGKFWRAPLSYRYAPANTFHRVELDKNIPYCWTIFIPSKSTQEWGFKTVNGWMQHEKYFKMKKVEKNLGKKIDKTE